MRHITLMIDREKIRNSNFILGFLAFYGKLCFVAYILCRFKLSFMEGIDYCLLPIITSTIHIDLVICVVIVLKIV